MPQGLTFTARLGLGKITEASMHEVREGSYGPKTAQKLAGGSVQVILTIPRPEPPDPPAKPEILRFTDGETSWYGGMSKRDIPEPPGEFVEPEREDEESDRKYVSRVERARKSHEASAAASAKFERDVANALDTYTAQLKRHEERLAAMARRYLDYGALPMLATVMGGLDMEVTIRPTSKAAGMLPGFLEQLTALPAPGSEAKPRRGRARAQADEGTHDPINGQPFPPARTFPEARSMDDALEEGNDEPGTDALEDEAEE